MTLGRSGQQGWSIDLAVLSFLTEKKARIKNWYQNSRHSAVSTCFILFCQLEEYHIVINVRGCFKYRIILLYHK